jgi:hypothetical protein
MDMSSRHPLYCHQSPRAFSSDGGELTSAVLILSAPGEGSYSTFDNFVPGIEFTPLTLLIQQLQR